MANGAIAIGAIAFLTGCAGPENKFGRGLANMTEIVRMGEMHRSMEQTGLWEGPVAAGTTGFARGLTRTLARTGVGIYEVVTAPLPPYGPVAALDHKMYPDHSVKTTSYPWGGLKMPEKPSFPASFTPGSANGVFNTDSSMGFSGGDVFPYLPGSRFRVFDH